MIGSVAASGTGRDAAVEVVVGGEARAVVVVFVSAVGGDGSLSVVIVVMIESNPICDLRVLIFSFWCMIIR